jgi:hypothetical protein
MRRESLRRPLQELPHYRTETSELAICILVSYFITKYEFLSNTIKNIPIIQSSPFIFTKYLLGGKFSSELFSSTLHLLSRGGALVQDISNRLPTAAGGV